MNTAPTIHLYRFAPTLKAAESDTPATGEYCAYAYPSTRYNNFRDIPDEEKPREKLIKHGAGALTAPELLAIVLGRGTVREDVLATAARVLHDYGEKGLAAQTNVARLAKDLSLTELKAAQIVACFELGRRFFERNPHGLAVLRSPEEVFEYAHDMRNFSAEHLRGLYLNRHYQVIHDEILSIGTIDAHLVHPREIFKPALEYGAAGIILVHNHPSGVVTPSAADREITKRLAESAKLMEIEFIDHVIVTSDSFESILHASKQH